MIRAAVGELGSVYGLPEEECRGIALAVDEALANIIRHAYHGERDRLIEMRCEGGADGLEFTLLDQGDPPDPERLEAHPLDDVALGGRGTHIMRAVMDEVRYEQSYRGNQVRLRKKVPAAVSAEGAGKTL